MGFSPRQWPAPAARKQGGGEERVPWRNDGEQEEEKAERQGRQHGGGSTLAARAQQWLTYMAGCLGQTGLLELGPALIEHDPTPPFGLGCPRQEVSLRKTGWQWLQNKRKR